MREGRRGLSFLVGALLLFSGLAAMAGFSIPGPPEDTVELAPASDRVIVRLEGVTDAAAAAAVLPEWGYRITRSLMPHAGLFLVGLEGLSVERAIEELSALPGVRYAQPDHQVQDRATYPNDPYFYKQWNMHNVGENPLAFKEEGSCQFNCSQVVASSCAGACGGKSPDGCWCDNLCEDDPEGCCPDYGVECGTTCKGACGSISADGCWCDAACVSNGDCCSDYAIQCQLGPSPPTGECGCTAACIDGKNCCWDACSQCGTCSGTTDADVDAPQAWDKGTSAVGSTDVVIALMDSGFDVDHTDLQSNIWQNPLESIGSWNFDDDGNGYKDDYNGWNAAYDDGFIVPAASGHGTKVLGVAGAVGNNGKGVAGIAWNAKMMLVVKGSGNSFVSTVVAGYEYVRVNKQKWLDTDGALGANVVVTSNSWGIFGSCLSQYGALQDAIEALGAVGILTVAAAANEDVNQDQVADVPSGCPSDYIVAVTNLDQNDAIAFAGYGQQSVDIGAPGEDVYTTVPDHDYANFYGTSAATPLVAGAIGLVHSLAPLCFKDFARDNPSAAALYMKDTILSNVDNVSSLFNKTVSGGRLNVYKAIQDIQYPASFECGDGCCHSAESYASCPMDCAPLVICGDGLCSSSESVSSCKQDCAGAGNCCVDHAGAGCNDLAVQNCVCNDPQGFGCCSGNWTTLCAAVADTCGSCSGDCCTDNGSPGCTGTACDDCVCNLDSYCCDTEWDNACAGLAKGLCLTSCDACEVCGDGLCSPSESVSSCKQDCAGAGNCCVEHAGAGCSDLAVQSCVCNDPLGFGCCSGNWTTLCAAIADTCGSCSGDCCTGNGSPGCTGTACDDCVCNLDSYCCDTEWDNACAGLAKGLCLTSCDACEVCGNGSCGEGEATTNCPEDCGTSGIDGVCNGGETQCTAPFDCGGECVQNSGQGQSCGNCGTKMRYCNDDCTWGSWGSCTDQGVCIPGDEISQGCGDCGVQTATCTSSCTWPGFSSCGGSGPCNDGDGCTLNDTCSSSGLCSGSPKSCDDGNPCTIDFCEGGSCVYQPHTEPCDDGNACSLGDTCQNGGCVGAQMNCSDGNECTNDFCSGGVCVNENNGYPCEDGSACTVGDFCSGGFCQGTLKDCNDGNSCTIDGCSNGNCTYQNTFSDCDDGNPCTVNDTCAGGTCTGPPKGCEDGFFCGPDGSCVCAPKCEGKSCGDDACGGKCGLCAEGEGCAQGECKPFCLTSSFCTEIPGDVTGDGFADISDVQCGVIAALWELAGSLGPMPMCCEDEWWRTDMNCDQVTDVSDVLLSVNMALALPMGGALDQNVDGCVDSCQDVPDPGCDTVFDE